MVPHSFFLSILLLRMPGQPQTRLHFLPYSRLVIVNLLSVHACWYGLQDRGCQFVITLRDNAVIKVYLFVAIHIDTKPLYIHFPKCTVSRFPFFDPGPKFFPYMHTHLPRQGSFGRWLLSNKMVFIPSHKWSNLL